MRGAVAVVVVTYHPDLEVLLQVLDAVTAQVSTGVVVDNGSPPAICHRLGAACGERGLTLLALGENLGLATAHNRGIAWVSERCCDFVLLLDQDSIPQPGMVEKLLQAHARLTDGGLRVAAVGPRYVDERNAGHPSFIRISGFRTYKEAGSSGMNTVATDVLISSGCLIKMEILERVGGMRDQFFIDQIDVEWCLRAKALGYHSFGVCHALLRHSLGESPKNIFGRKILHHGPARSYYIFRNAVALLREPYVPLGWKIKFVRTLGARLTVYLCFFRPRFEYLRMMTRGIWHGLLKKEGKHAPAARSPLS
jgi:rhamnosyltransferase